MGRLLCVVQDTFEIEGRGIRFWPAMLLQSDAPIGVGDLVRFQRPDGSSAEHRVGALELVFGGPPTQPASVFLAFEGLSKTDLPIGTEVYSVSESH